MQAIEVQQAQSTAQCSGSAAVEMLLFGAFFSSGKTLKIPEKFSGWASAAQRGLSSAPKRERGSSFPHAIRPSNCSSCSDFKVSFEDICSSLSYTLSRSSLSALIHQTLNNFLPPLNSHVCISPLYWFGKIPIFQKAARACCTPQPVRPIPAPTTPQVIFIKCVKFDTPKRFSPLLIHRVSGTNPFINLWGASGTQDTHEESV